MKEKSYTRTADLNFRPSGRDVTPDPAPVPVPEIVFRAVDPAGSALSEHGGCNGCGFHPDDPSRAAAYVLIVANGYTRFCTRCAGVLRAAVSAATQRDPRVPGL